MALVIHWHAALGSYVVFTGCVPPSYDVGLLVPSSVPASLYHGAGRAVWRKEICTAYRGTVERQRVIMSLDAGVVFS
jgi:hypothetical protein